MLKLWRAYRLAFLTWVFCGIATIIGLLVLNPVYVNVCEPTEDGACQKYQQQNALYIAFSYAVDLATSATFWTAIATIFIAYFTYTLKRSTDKLWSAALAAEKRQEADTRILQRAYLSIEPRGVSPGINNPSVELVGHIGIRNMGHLPATNVSWTTKIEYSSNENREQFPDLSPWHGGKHQVAAGSMMTQTGAPINFGSPDRYLYVWGEVRYLDGFGNRRAIRYCHRYNTGRFPKDPTAKRRIRPRYGRYHEHGNATDES